MATGLIPSIQCLIKYHVCVQETIQSLLGNCQAHELATLYRLATLYKLAILYTDWPNSFVAEADQKKPWLRQISQFCFMDLQ